MLDLFGEYPDEISVIDASNISIRHNIGDQSEVTEQIKNIEIADAAKLTTGSLSGVLLNPGSMHIEHAEQLSQSEFGLICLWTKNEDSKVKIIFKIVSTIINHTPLLSSF